MKIAMITAGAAGMYCGSCMHDNTLAAAITDLGHDAVLIPTYTPIRTDEVDVSQRRVFFGGINVYLQQKVFLFRYTPWFLDRLWDMPRLLRWVSRYAMRTQADTLGDLTISMLKGKDGFQRKEVAKLATWLEQELKPDVVTLTNVLLSGVVPELKERLGKPVLAHLQGDDIFLEALPVADRMRAKTLIRQNCQQVDGFLVTSRYYADFMAEYLGLPSRKMHVIHPGLNLEGYGAFRPFRHEPPFTIGYFARICPEKGLHILVEAYRLLRTTTSEVPPTRLRISGWLGEHQRDYFAQQIKLLEQSGLQDEVEHLESPSHADKIDFMHSIDVLSVPTTYREPKGLYILEAMANGVPVVQPGHGSFPELVEATQGGLIVEPDNPAALAEGLRQIITDVPLRQRLSEQGQKAVFARYHARRMAEETHAVCAQFA